MHKLPSLSAVTDDELVMMIVAETRTALWNELSLAEQKRRIARVLKFAAVTDDEGPDKPFHFHSKDCYAMGPGDTDVLVCSGLPLWMTAGTEFKDLPGKPVVECATGNRPVLSPQLPTDRQRQFALPDDEGIAKENEDGWDILICQSCGQDVGRGRPGAGVTILKCVPCSQLSTEVLRESPPAKEKNVPQTSTLERLDALAARPDLRQQGWDSYGANPLDDRAIEAARAFLGYAWAVGPTSNGGIQLEIHCSGFDIEIEFDETGKAETASAEVFGEIPRVRPLDEQLEMLTRYDAVSSWETALMREKAYGEYVRYADVEKLVAPRVRDVPSPAVEQGRIQASGWTLAHLNALREIARGAPAKFGKTDQEYAQQYLDVALSVEAPAETKEQP